jgi:hypothetical protein
MKNALILVLAATVAWLAFGQAQSAPLAVQDTTLLHRADLPRWKPGSVADQMLFAPCPIEPRVYPKWQERTA